MSATRALLLVQFWSRTTLPAPSPRMGSFFKRGHPGSALYVLLSALQVCRCLAARWPWHWMGRSTSAVGLPPKVPSASTREDGLGPGFYVRQPCKSGSWHLLCLYTWNYRFWSIYHHLCGEVVCFCPARESQGGLRSSAYVGVLCTAAHCGSGIPAFPRASGALTLRPNSGSLITSRRQIPGPHRPSTRHSLWPGVSGTALHPATAALQEGTGPTSPVNSPFRQVFYSTRRVCNYSPVRFSAETPVVIYH